MCHEPRQLCQAAEARYFAAMSAVRRATRRLGGAIAAFVCSPTVLGALYLLVLTGLASRAPIVAEGDRALGAQARVYLAVPAEKSGTGTVTVPIQGRTMQFKAITRGREIKTGALCKVVSVASSDTLEVESL